MPFTNRPRLRVAVVCTIAASALALSALGAHESAPRNTGAVTTIPQKGQPILVESFDAHPAGERWLDGDERGPWKAVYDGYGRTEVTAGPERRLAIAPRSAPDPTITHGGLVTTLGHFDDIDLTASMATLRQLRNGPANPWEVAWLLWHYTDDNHFYSLALKPNGWELGKEDPAYPGAQRFLATGATPSFPIGVLRLVRVRHVGNTMTVWVDGQRLTTYTDNERPYFRGRIGLYTEDAHVLFDEIVVRRP